MKSDGAFDAIVRRMPPVGLDEVNQGAALQTRTDRKYIVTPEQLEALAVDVADTWSVLQLEGGRRFAYSTTYHDTPDRRLHRDTAHRRPRRFKVRVREYADSGLAMLEVKTKNGRSRTVKHRVNVADLEGSPFSPHGPLTDQMRAYVDSVMNTDLTAELEPTIRIDFHRTTLLANEGDSRCTIDLGLRGERPDGHSVAPDLIVIETKSELRASVVDRWLWAHHLRPARISKYCTLMAALDSSLPANHWHRLLNAHFPPRRPPAPARSAG